MMMKSVIWWRKPEYPEETTDLRQVTDEINKPHLSDVKLKINDSSLEFYGWGWHWGSGH